MNQDQIAKEYGKSRGHVNKHIALFKKWYFIARSGHPVAAPVAAAVAARVAALVAAAVAAAATGVVRMRRLPGRAHVSLGGDGLAETAGLAGAFVERRLGRVGVQFGLLEAANPELRGLRG